MKTMFLWRGVWAVGFAGMMAGPVLASSSSTLLEPWTVGALERRYVVLSMSRIVTSQALQNYEESGEAPARLVARLRAVFNESEASLDRIEKEILGLHLGESEVVSEETFSHFTDLLARVWPGLDGVSSRIPEKFGGGRIESLSPGAHKSSSSRETSCRQKAILRSLQGSGNREFEKGIDRLVEENPDEFRGLSDLTQGSEPVFRDKLLGVLLECGDAEVVRFLRVTSHFKTNDNAVLRLIFEQSGSVAIVSILDKLCSMAGADPEESIAVVHEWVLNFYEDTLKAAAHIFAGYPGEAWGCASNQAERLQGLVADLRAHCEFSNSPSEGVSEFLYLLGVRLSHLLGLERRLRQSMGEKLIEVAEQLKETTGYVMELELGESPAGGTGAVPAWALMGAHSETMEGDERETQYLEEKLKSQKVEASERPCARCLSEFYRDVLSMVERVSQAFPDYLASHCPSCESVQKFTENVEKVRWALSGFAGEIWPEQERQSVLTGESAKGIYEKLHEIRKVVEELEQIIGLEHQETKTSGWGLSAADYFELKERLTSDARAGIFAAVHWHTNSVVGERLSAVATTIGEVAGAFLTFYEDNYLPPPIVDEFSARLVAVCDSVRGLRSEYAQGLRCDSASGLRVSGWRFLTAEGLAWNTRAIERDLDDLKAWVRQLEAEQTPRPAPQPSAEEAGEPGMGDRQVQRPGKRTEILRPSTRGVELEQAKLYGSASSVRSAPVGLGNFAERIKSRFLARSEKRERIPSMDELTERFGKLLPAIQNLEDAFYNHCMLYVLPDKPGMKFSRELNELKLAAYHFPADTVPQDEIYKQILELEGRLEGMKGQFHEWESRPGKLITSAVWD